MENPAVDAAFGMHIGQDLPVGTVGVADRIGNAAADSFTATIYGQGGHAARPHLVVDPVVVACEVVSALQLLISRELDPLKSAVITVGAINAGATHNVIPAEATIKGTVRTFEPDVQDLLSERVPAVIRGISETLRATCEVNYQRGYPPLVNDVEMVELVRNVARGVVGDDRLIVRPPSMGGEDMAYFLQRVPGCFFRIGSKNPEKGLIYAHHHPRFDFDDEVALPVGVATLASVALTYLNQA
jgi:amidohydrolase